MKEFIKGANPYMPLWEHVPDGEPRVFEFNGEKRVYLYGSHDTLRTEYCGPDQVVWSAPVDDLTNWTCHGVCYTSTDGSILYAPDVVQKGDTFYLYAAEAKGSRIMLATSKNPAGPFTNPVKTELAFDPGILVDDDGRVYAYWGFCKQYCAELNDDMATIKKETLRENVIKHSITQWSPDDGMADEEDAFFEASSPRKVFGKYVLIYSKRYYTPRPKYGVYEDCNGFLSFKYSDTPLGDFKMGGDISFNGGELIPSGDGNSFMTYRWGNNHGSIMNVNGQWYVFYHRQTGTDEFSRQAMIECVDVAMDSKGKIFIGKISYKDGEPVASEPVEMTSQGAHLNGLDARKIISAGYAVHIYGGAKGGYNGGKGGAYIKPVYEKNDSVSSPIVDITSSLTVGFRYLQFGNNSPQSLSAKISALENLRVNVRLDEYKGKLVAAFQMNKGESFAKADLLCGITGKHALYFEFLSESKNVIAEFDTFTFD
ncbi:MAG: family 43 glycosylhydrolase [Treponema sp.]|nr:family 43 glycosylhydrolase [Treponema sp.]